MCEIICDFSLFFLSLFCAQPSVEEHGGLGAQMRRGEAQTFCHFLFSLMSKVWEKGKTCCPFQQRTQEENNAEIL